LRAPFPPLLRLAAFHNPPSSRIVDVGELSEATLWDFTAKLELGYALALSSAVETQQNTVRHIPMLDFRGLEPPQDVPIAEHLVSQLGTPGSLLKSGQSFHFYGDRLVEFDELTNFLARAMLFGPFVDVRWIAHQLMESSCSLRISPSRPGEPPPTLVARVGRSTPS
jgi:hypothetical protein